jgi:hypothetical protein
VRWDEGWAEGARGRAGRDWAGCEQLHRRSRPWLGGRPGGLCIRAGVRGRRGWPGVQVFWLSRDSVPSLLNCGPRLQVAKSPHALRSSQLLPSDAVLVAIRVRTFGKNQSRRPSTGKQRRSADSPAMHAERQWLYVHVWTRLPHTHTSARALIGSQARAGSRLAPALHSPCARAWSRGAYPGTSKRTRQRCRSDAAAHVIAG